MADRTPLEALYKRLGANFKLGSAEHKALSRLDMSLREFEPGQYILREGDRPRYCAYLTQGYVYRHKIVGDGGRQIVSIHVPGDFVDVQNILLDYADHNIQALTATTLITVPVEDLMRAAMEHSSINRALWRDTLVEASIMREWIANIGRRDARSRTAHMLCEVALRREKAGLGARETFDLPMTQEQLGDALGLTAVHVNRTLKSLENDGLIIRSKRSVTVADWNGLQSVGDFTSNYLHFPQGT